MKKLTLLIACLLALSLCLCACGNDGGENTESPGTETVGTENVTADPKALAESCIDKTVQELYALIGEPESSEYVPSCLGPGEDGNLYYADFTVYTYREGDTETVRVVE